MESKHNRHTNLLTVDCCKHITQRLESTLNSGTTVVSATGALESNANNSHIDLVIIGTPGVPVRRLYLSRLRRFFPDTPILVLRRDHQNIDSDKEVLRGEFVLSDHREQSDLEIVRLTREILPMPACEHSQSDSAYELIRKVTGVLADNLGDAELDLEQVADELSVSPTRLSRILNREVHISFRQMLRQLRIEEAKRLLATSKLSIKEIAARVGFSDSHYFSRIFKQMTGYSPSEYVFGSQDLIFN